MNLNTKTLSAITLALGSLPLTINAEQISMPNTFQENAAALASEVNSNFDTLVQESNAQDQRITTLESKQATVSTQIVTQTGALNGYTPSTTSVQCPEGTTVISGGISMLTNSFYSRCFTIQTSYPRTTSTGSSNWTTSLRRSDFGEGSSHCPNTASWPYEAYAVCLKLNDE